MSNSSFPDEQIAVQVISHMHFVLNNKLKNSDLCHYSFSIYLCFTLRDKLKNNDWCLF